MSNGSNTELSIIADRYATAMIELGEKLNCLDKFESDFNLISATLVANKELDTFLSHPTIPLADKKDVIDKIFADSISSNMLNLMKLLLDRNRIIIFSSIAGHYIDTLNKKRNISLAKVITAIEIDEGTKNRIKSKLESILNQNIVINTEIDPDIIAGMIIKVGDNTIDGSIKTRLESMKKQLI